MESMTKTLAEQLAKEYEFVKRIMGKLKNGDNENKEITKHTSQPSPLKKLKKVQFKTVKDEGKPNSRTTQGLEFKKEKKISNENTIGKRRREIALKLQAIKKKKGKPALKGQKLKLRRELLVLNKKAAKEKKLEIKSEIQEDDKKKVRKLTENPTIVTKSTKLVFNKFDFNYAQKERWVDNRPKDLNKNLSDLKEHEGKINKLEDKGQLTKASNILTKQAWEVALQKVDGLKVKDDPEKLKKTIKKRMSQKKSSEIKWNKRKEDMEERQRKAQEKRNENLKKRNDEKKEKRINKRMGIKKPKGKKKPKRK